MKNAAIQPISPNISDKNPRHVPRSADKPITAITA
jgi:hypothetical protein